jgi:hypothetical protein
MGLTSATVNGNEYLLPTQITGESVFGVDSNDGGGGVNAINHGTLILNGGEIRDNTTPHFGGGVYIAGSFILDDGLITGNNA